jgi:uncharacterized protein (TIGR02421 family)
MQPFELNPYQQTLRSLSERIVEAQKPIRILNSLKWPADIQSQFFEKNCKELPPVTAATYHKNPLQFEPNEKREEFYAIERDIRRQLGQFSGVANVMLRICREYREVVRLLEARGTPEFTKISQELYGSSQDAFYAGAPTLRDLAELVSTTLGRIKTPEPDPLDEKRFTSEEAVQILGERLGQYFGGDDRQVRVKLSDDILADASAGAEYIKLRRDAKFSERELRSFEVHEGWVHIGTTLNGLAQPVCTFLSKGPPSSTINQEGLAIIMEIFTFCSYPLRVKRLTQRVSAIDLAEGGADFLDIFHYYCHQGLTEEESYNATVRIFRGCLPDKGPFTKDLSYSKGFVLIYNYIRLAIKNGLQSRIPLLFMGKTTLEDLHILADLQEEGIVTPPKYLPPQFRDLAALSAWMIYSLFLNTLSLEQLTVDYKGILHE